MAGDPVLTERRDKPAAAGSGQSSILRSMALGLLVLAIFIAAMLILWGCEDDTDTVSTDDPAAAAAADDDDDDDDADADATDEGEDADSEAANSDDGNDDADSKDADSQGEVADSDDPDSDDPDSDDADFGDEGEDADSDDSDLGDEGEDADSDDSDFGDEGEDADSDDADADDSGVVAPLTESASVMVAITDDEVTLSGVVADLSTQSALVDTATEQFAPRTVTDEIQLDAQVAQSEEPGEIVMSGEVGTEGRRSTLLAGAAALADASEGLVVVDELTVSEAGSSNAVAAEVTELFAAEPVQFDSGSSTIRSESFATLDNAATLLVDAPPEVRVEIGGHTDDDGNAETNAELSLARAEAVRDYLVGQGASPDQMLARGYGQARPIASNETDEGKAINRRIEARPLA